MGHVVGEVLPQPSKRQMQGVPSRVAAATGVLEIGLQVPQERLRVADVRGGAVPAPLGEHAQRPVESVLRPSFRLFEQVLGGGDFADQPVELADRHARPSADAARWGDNGFGERHR